MRKMLRTCFQTRELTNSHGSRNREALGVGEALGVVALGVRPSSAAHNAVGLAGESPVVGIDCLPT